jgi:putative SOS response-associated peptidase YedK
MCGRYTLTAEQEALQAALGVALLLEDHPHPRFNIAPTQEAPVLAGPPPARGNDAPRVRRMRWGLVPAWADDPSIGSRLINARSETAATKPSFRGPFRTGRCLVPADGFYEWSTGAPGPPPGKQDAREKGAGPRTPWFIYRPEREPFTLAGLMDRWIPPAGGPPLESFTLLTTAATGDAAGLHHRMPVVVGPGLRDAWLGSGAEGDAALEALLEAVLEDAGVQARDFRAHPVSRRVNRPQHDDPSLVEPAAPAGPDQGSLFD